MCPRRGRCRTPCRCSRPWKTPLRVLRPSCWRSSR
uniref:Uncharacterized protein n=1 Tax=Anguilla anguilla TaxID=7936 RepID=A0A0E9UX38_ANGAN